MQAVHVDLQENRRHLILSEAPPPARKAGEILVSVNAISLNHGEIHTALNDSPAGWRPGWEYAGIVLESDTDSRFLPGDRVFGLMLEGAWAEQIAAPEQLAAAVPDNVEFETVVSLPVAGMTAMLALSKKQLGPGNRVLVTAATGAVGRLAIQLASEANAHVTALIRSPADDTLVRSLGARDIVLLEDGISSKQPFDLILEGVGGTLLAEALVNLTSEGICVLFGNAAHDDVTTFRPDAFRLRPGTAYGGTMLYGFFLGNELGRIDTTSVLSSLAEKVGSGRLDPSIAIVEDWRNTDAVARAVLGKEIVGRAVLRVPQGTR